jgi:glutamyl-tRNA reductase
MAELPISVFGVDHHRTPVQVRERMAVAHDAVDEALALLARQPGCSEVVCLSTCNRVEFYFGGSPDRTRVAQVIAERQGIPADLLQSHGYWHAGGDCVRHLFRVAASLESAVVGEYQIVQQIKTAYERAHLSRHTSQLLNPLFQRALWVAKEVRNQTAIGKHKLSMASVAVDLAKHIHGDLSTARLLIIGAGEIAELAVKYLVGAGVRVISICNRSEERAIGLAGAHQSQAIAWSQLQQALGEHDIVISSTSAPNLVVMQADVRAAMKRRRNPLMLIDLAVPRDIDDTVRLMENVYLYNIDSLEAVVSANRALRNEEIEPAVALVNSLATSYAASQANEGSLLADVAEFFQDIIAAEEVRLAGKLGMSDSKELRYGLERVGNKLQHQLLRFLRDHPGDHAVEATIREMLGLSRDDSKTG